MAARARVRGTAMLVCVALGLVSAGCASTSILPGHRGGHSCAGTAHQDGPAAPAAQVAVICRWSAALRAGRLSRAAAYFRLPSLFSDGTGVIPVRTRRQALIVNASLSCGAQVISAFRSGRVVNVLFRLTARAGPGGGAGSCGSGVGESARTVFLIHDGHILEWLRAPSRPGDPGAPSQSSTTPSGGSSV